LLQALLEQLLLGLQVLVLVGVGMLGLVLLLITFLIFWILQVR